MNRRNPDSRVDHTCLRRVFAFIDENGDGKISPSELRLCLQILGEEISDEAAAAVVTASDSDGDGLLGFDDFAALVGDADEAEEEKVEWVREAFAMYDEGGGVITAASLRKMLGRLGEMRTVEECRVMIRAFDLDGDGVIDFDEFRVMLAAAT